MFTNQTLDLAASAIVLAKGAKTTLVIAESCTGGLVAGALTAISGSSSVLGHAIISYSNQSKQQFLKVNPSLIQDYGAVSPQCAKAMAEGAQKTSNLDTLAISITGVAGPIQSETKPVGLVYFGAIMPLASDATIYEHHFKGNRNQIRFQAVETALNIIIDALAQQQNLKAEP